MRQPRGMQHGRCAGARLLDGTARPPTVTGMPSRPAERHLTQHDPAQPPPLPVWARLAAAELPAGALRAIATLDPATWPLLAVNPAVPADLLARLRSPRASTPPLITRQVDRAWLWGPAATADDLAAELDRPSDQRDLLALTNPALPEPLRRCLPAVVTDTRQALHLLDNPALEFDQAADLLARYDRLDGPTAEAALQEVVVPLLLRLPELTGVVLHHLPRGARVVAQLPGGLGRLRRRDRSDPEVHEVLRLVDRAGLHDSHDPLLDAAECGSEHATAARRLTVREDVALRTSAACAIDAFVRPRAADGTGVNPWMAPTPFTRCWLSWTGRFTDAPARRELWGRWGTGQPPALAQIGHRPLPETAAVLAPLGSDPDAWSTTLHLLAEWDGSLEELVDTVVRLGG